MGDMGSGPGQHHDIRQAQALWLQNQSKDYILGDFFFPFPVTPSSVESRLIIMIIYFKFFDFWLIYVLIAKYSSVTVGYTVDSSRGPSKTEIMIHTKIYTPNVNL